MFRAGRLLKLPRNVDLNEKWEVDLVVDALLERCRENLRRGDKYGLVLGLDTETTGLNLIQDRVYLYSFYSPELLTIPGLGIHEEACAYVVLGGMIHRQENMEALEPITAHPKIIKAGANMSGFDWFMFRNHGVNVVDPIHDTIWMDWLANENRPHGLKKCMWDYYRFRMQDYKKAGGGELDIRKWDYDSALQYPGQDAFASYKVWEFLQQKLSTFFMGVGNAPSKKREKEWLQDGFPTGWDFYQEFLVPVQNVVRNMMSRGVQVDMEYLDELGNEVQRDMQALHATMNRTWEELQVSTGKFYATDNEREKDEDRVRRGLKRKFTGPENYRPLNLNNTYMLRFFFYELLDYTVLKKTKPGVTGISRPSLDKDVLTEFAEEFGCPYAQTILDYRNLAKLYGTYIGDEPDESIEGVRHKDKGGLRSKVIDGRVYTHFKIGPVTGRLASSGPNLMNIPARTALGRRVKEAFIAAPGYLLVCADYEQLEMRLFAHFADEPAMIEAILSGKDLHCVTASLMYGISYQDLKESKRKDEEREELSEYDKQLLSYRAAAKTIGFGCHN